MTTHATVPGDLFARTQTIAGLRALADFLENNPDIPIHEYGWDYLVFPRADNDTAERAEIDRIATALGETVTDDTGHGGHYKVSKTFGRITYTATHVPTKYQAAHEALMSYAPVFHPDRYSAA
jgi:hypothetical protein